MRKFVLANTNSRVHFRNLSMLGTRLEVSGSAGHSSVVISYRKISQHFFGYLLGSLQNQIGLIKNGTKARQVRRDARQYVPTRWSGEAQIYKSQRLEPTVVQKAPTFVRVKSSASRKKQLLLCLRSRLEDFHLL